MRTLFVAAGGGGDAVGILLARRVLDPDGAGPALIATCAWERLRIDPVPGPRSLDGFIRLGQVDHMVVEVLATSDTEPSGRSMLPRLAAEADARIFLHDFEGGATGLAEHLRGLAAALSVDRLVVVDVGGDVVATGDEPNLLSPLADSITFAAALLTGIPTTLAVIGPGTDAELGESEVLGRLRYLDANLVGHVVPHGVDQYQHVLAWHPTEASALVAAAALGERGAVEMRRGNQPTPLTQHGCEVWVIEAPQFPDFPLASALTDSGTLAQAVEVIDKLALNEIAYERAKANRVVGMSRRCSARPVIKKIADEAMAHGATHITTRRLLEQAGIAPSAVSGTLAQLKSSAGPVGGLWDLRVLTSCSV